MEVRMTQQQISWDDVKISNGNAIKGSDIYVTIFITTAKTANLFLSSALMRQQSATYVVLGWSVINNALLLFLSNDADHPGAIKLSKKGGATASIQSFLNSCNIDKNSIIGKYIPKRELISENKSAWVIYLSEKVPELV
jgi:hypothetical protein